MYAKSGLAVTLFCSILSTTSWKHSRCKTYLLNVPNVRSESPHRIIRQLYDLIDQRLKHGEWVPKVQRRSISKACLDVRMQFHRRIDAQHSTAVRIPGSEDTHLMPLVIFLCLSFSPHDLRNTNMWFLGDFLDHLDQTAKPGSSSATLVSPVSKSSGNNVL